MRVVVQQRCGQGLDKRLRHVREAGSEPRQRITAHDQQLNASR
jgi:hypothetical protein